MFWARPYPAVTVQAEGMLSTHQIGQILKEGQILKHGVFFSPFGILDGTGSLHNTAAKPKSLLVGVLYVPVNTRLYSRHATFYLQNTAANLKTLFFFDPLWSFLKHQRMASACVQ